MKQITILFLVILLCGLLYVSLGSQPEMVEKTNEERILNVKCEYGPVILSMMSYNVPKNKRQIYADSIIESTIKWSDEFGVDILWAFSLEARESCFNPRARGKHGDCGITQITQYAIREYERVFKIHISQSEVFNIDRNIEIGVWYLSQKVKENKGNYRVALAKYNAGKYWNTSGLEYYRLVNTMRTTILTKQYELVKKTR